MNIVPVLTTVAWVLSVVFTVYVFYYFGISLFAFKRRSHKKQYEPKNKFAILIAARNEEQVIPHLVESLKMQNYPKELYDIIVIPNNCTDHTREAALQAGACVLDCTAIVKSKGDVLSFAFDKVMAGQTKYDAFCVFDADNLVHPDFLRVMNNTLCGGAQLAQGYRDSKNPYDSAISGCYSIYYWMINRFYNGARSALGLSALINGSGFMVKAEVIREMNGFHTFTMTEDLEFTTQCILRGKKVVWVPEAVIFDEQPLTFKESWKQRKRWSTGCIQGLTRYVVPLMQKAVKEKDFQCVDQILFYLTPVLQMVYLLSLLLHFTLHLLYVQYVLFPDTQLYYKMFLSLQYTYLSTVAGVLLILMLEKKFSLRIFKGLIGYWLFMMSWIPINLICFFKKTTVWHEIKHTRSIRLIEMTAAKGK